MKHQDAVETLAAERYVLGEMNEDDANEFEEHYFGCGECAEAVRNGARFFESGKSVVREPQQKVARGFLYWFPSAAAAMVTMAIGYLLPHAHEVAPMVMAVNLVPLSSGTRAGTTETVVAQHRGQTTLLSFDIPPEPSFPAYRWELHDASGKTLEAHDVSAESAKDPILVSLTSSLPAGQYVLVVRGAGNRPEVARFPFNAKPVE